MGRDNQILTDHYKTTGVATARRVRGRRESLFVVLPFLESPICETERSIEPRRLARIYRVADYAVVLVQREMLVLPSLGLGLLSIGPRDG